MKNKRKQIEVGDLVTHLLYGAGWIGIVVSLKEEVAGTLDKRRKQALVQICPETEFDGFFRRSSPADRINDNLGYVSVHWLFKVVDKNEDT